MCGRFLHLEMNEVKRSDPALTYGIIKKARDYLLHLQSVSIGFLIRH